MDGAEGGAGPPPRHGGADGAGGDGHETGGPPSGAGGEGGGDGQKTPQKRSQVRPSYTKTCPEPPDLPTDAGRNLGDENSPR